MIPRLKPVLLSLLLLAGAAAQAQTDPLPPFKAVYTSEFDLGISLSGEVVRQLRREADGRWLFSSEASALMAGIRETTAFDYHDGALIRPLEYDYQRKVLGKSRRASIDFDWSEGKATTVVKETPWKMSVDVGTQDKLSYQLQMRLDLKAGRREMTYRVADGGKLKTYAFAVTGEEPVETPLCTFDAIRVMRDRGEGSERETLIWFAPELDYLIVRLQQTEPDGKTYDLLLKGLAQP
jgi:hypothetical protein